MQWSSSWWKYPLLRVDGDPGHTWHVDHGSHPGCGWQEKACHEHHWSHCIRADSGYICSITMNIMNILNFKLITIDNFSKCPVPNGIGITFKLLWSCCGHWNSIWYNSWFNNTAIQWSVNSCNLLGMYHDIGISIYTHSNTAHMHTCARTLHMHVSSCIHRLLWLASHIFMNVMETLLLEVNSTTVYQDRVIIELTLKTVVAVDI